MRYILKNRRGQKLSGFYPNAGEKSKFLAYRKNDYICYSTPEEAADHLRYIQSHNVGRSLNVEIDYHNS